MIFNLYFAAAFLHIHGLDPLQTISSAVSKLSPPEVPGAQRVADILQADEKEALEKAYSDLTQNIRSVRFINGRLQQNKYNQMLLGKIGVGGFSLASALKYPGVYGETKSGRVPIDFNGIFWIDDNSEMGDIAFSFANSEWHSVAQEGYKCRTEMLTNPDNGEEIECIGGMQIQAYDSYNWVVRSQDSLGLEAADLFPLTFDVECGGYPGAPLNYCEIKPTLNFDLGFLGVDGNVDPDSIRIRLTRVDNDTWIRKITTPVTTGSPLIARYKRIHKGDGSAARYHNQFYLQDPTLSEEDRRADVFGFNADTRSKIAFYNSWEYAMMNVNAESGGY